VACGTYLQGCLQSLHTSACIRRHDTWIVEKQRHSVKGVSSTLEEKFKRVENIHILPAMLKGFAQNAVKYPYEL
jgi:hypothetical protein